MAKNMAEQKTKICYWNTKSYEIISSENDNMIYSIIIAYNFTF